MHAERTDGRTKTHPELFHKLANAYAQVVDNLGRQKNDWPTASELRSVIRSGSAGYGIDDFKPGRSNEASQLIEAAILNNDARPLHIVY